jgi:predicted aconitase with swiveling domain
MRAITLVPGTAEGEVFVMAEPLSFWGGLDPATGAIIDRWHPQCGTVLTGKVVVMERGRGSSSGSSVLAEAIRAGTAPAAIVMLTRDAIVTLGALVGRELYGKDCPVVMAEAADWPALTAAGRLTVEAGGEGAAISG